ncbi:hypothetical protein BGZ50_008727 [Haplosporangium sp. Z 11]|nr:hypothetical protein BGZ50_008727 [Haplosporangium sp. Z 11]
MTMEEMIPDLTHYSHGLDPSTFPLIVETNRNNDNLLATFNVTTLEQLTVLISLDGQGFKVVSYSVRAPPSLSDSNISNSPLPSSERQQEAISGKVYETIEALLMALSPRFEVFFSQELSRKLEAVSWDSAPRRFHMDDSDSDSDSEAQQDAIK